MLVMVWAGCSWSWAQAPSALLLRMKGRTVHPLPNTRRCMDQIPSWDSWGCHSLLVPLQGGAWQEDSGKGRAKEEASPRTMLLPPSAWGPVSPFLGQSRSARYLPMSKMLLISPHQSPPAFPCWASIFGRKTLHCFSCPIVGSVCVCVNTGGLLIFFSCSAFSRLPLHELCFLLLRARWGSESPAVGRAARPASLGLRCLSHGG